MLETILDLLESDERVTGWQLREIEKRSSQLYVNPEREESFRRVDSLVFEVEILVNRRATADGKKRVVTGSSKFTLDPSSVVSLPKELEQALASAELVENEAYSMTEVGAMMPQVPLSDPLLIKDPEAMLRREAAILRKAVGQEKSVRFSAAEFFADLTKLRYFNSQGVQVFQESTLYSGEFVLLAGAPGAESEVFRTFKSRRVSDLDLAALAAESALKGRQRVRAVLPKTGSYDVVFSGEALDHFFSWIISSASAASRYNRMTRFEPGDTLVESRPGASPLTLWHNALLPYAVGSYRVDATGSPGGRRLLIENGRLKSRWANARYAQYLKQAATGDLGNIVVEAGAHAPADLLKPQGGRPPLPPL